MKVEIERQGSVTVIVPRDALTESTIEEVCAAFEQTSAGSPGVRTVLDLSQVPYLDSTGIETLLQVAGRPGPLCPRIAGLNETVREALLITDTLKRFSVFDSVEAAVRSYL